MGGRSTTAEAKAARIAAAAHGIVTRAELRRAGVTDRQIDRRIEKGALIPEYPGVYRVGHAAPSWQASYTAAVKACGDSALLCGRAAAYLWGILKSPAPPPPEVLTTSRRRIQGLTIRRTRVAERGTRFKNIPVISVTLALVQLAAELDDDTLARACHEAGVKFGTTPNHVRAVLERRPNSPGAAKLRRVMGGDTKVVLSKLEKRFLERLEAAGLPLPQTNRVAGGRRVDCRWPDHRLTVELDGFRFHNSRHSWRQGLRREREARKRRDEFRRYDYEDVFAQPAEMLAELRGLLA